MAGTVTIYNFATYDLPTTAVIGTVCRLKGFYVVGSSVTSTDWVRVVDYISTLASVVQTTVTTASGNVVSGANNYAAGSALIGTVANPFTMTGIVTLT